MVGATAATISCSQERFGGEIENLHRRALGVGVDYAAAHDRSATVNGKKLVALAHTEYADGVLGVAFGSRPVEAMSGA